MCVKTKGETCEVHVRCPCRRAQIEGKRESLTRDIYGHGQAGRVFADHRTL
jgi:hypothetical protein